jgi:uncharacterized protein with NRDE domain
MCLAVVALDAHPAFALVVAANRDEFHARAAAPAAWGDAPPFARILAGRDLEAGGTWLGVRRDGRWALVTNVREGGRHDPNARSRGDLVPEVLNATRGAGDALQALAAAGSRYNGFNLLAGDAAAAHWISNRGGDAVPLARGLHGLSNALLDTPWPKLERTAARMRAWVARAETDAGALFAALADRTQAADDALPDTGVPREWERLLSSPFIVSERYGTRCSTVFTVDRTGRARFHERTFDARGDAVSDVVETFDVA